MSQGYVFSSARRSFHLPVGDGLQVHIEEYGCGSGIPVLVCHGGPGTGLQPSCSCLFNPQYYRIILFSQRGCGLSSSADLEQNTPACLIQDMQMILQHLDIAKAVIAGGSWGASLALLFQQHHPDKVLGLVLWGAFLAQQADLEWAYGSLGAGAQFYPERYQKLNHSQFTTERLLLEYYQALRSDDQLLQHKAAQSWMQWEHTLAHGANYTADTQHCITRSIQQALLMVHFFNAPQFKQLSAIGEYRDSLKHLPMWLIHSRDDLLCRFNAAQAFADKHSAQLFILDGAGHAVNQAVHVDAITRATDLMVYKLH